ncbi:pyridoxamine 5'-phosphate oxidase family protein [Naumannella halotolerans]|uniref:General stress protein 26 n=1 Tax=Naumannella halotolerans TaxID=993414 RepID=A0A4R7J5S3_9ACTN|nr:pyridoxamine 5'-phosphate oxidase family protein [Naumannella halotolerans]TDT32712.1 general stress protein 26 [Naumannella halotolerans]
MSDEAQLTPAEKEAADRQAIAEVVEKAELASVTTIRQTPSTIDDGQALVSRPLALAGDAEFDGNLYFIVPTTSDLAEQVRRNAAVNVAIDTDGNWLSIAGSGVISTDQALIDKLWNKAAEAWFEGGRTDPAVGVLQVSAESGELQSADGPALIALAKYVKNVVQGEKPDIGDSTRVEF